MRSRTLLLLACLSLATACSRSSESSPTSSSSTSSSTPAPAPAAAKGELKKLTVEEVAARIAARDGKTFVYDDNDKERYQQGHLPGARWVESGDVTAAVLPADKTATLVFYCASEA